MWISSSKPNVCLRGGLTRHTSIYILFVHSIVLLPHLINLPIVISLSSLLPLIWRAGSIWRNWPVPNKIAKVILVAGGFAIVFSAFGTLMGPLAGVALLVVAFSLKSLEASTRQDAYTAITLAYFVVASAFLFDQSFFIALYLLLSSAVISLGLIANNKQISLTKSDIQSALFLILKSTPFMVVLFMFVPRIDAFWGLEFNHREAKVGLSDEMSPGDFARLGASDEVAFRVRFDENLPPKSSLYWRALVLDQFDGRRWKQSSKKAVNQHTNNLSEEDVWLERYRTWFGENSQEHFYRYEVAMEASNKPWLIALDWARPLSPGVSVNADYSLARVKPVNEPYIYRAESRLPKRDGAAPEWMNPRAVYSEQNLGIPGVGNPKTREWAAALREQSGTDELFIQNILTYFDQQSFYYTLKPPPLGKNSIDDFMFGTRRGFCAHYASAFTFMVRSAGIPARVVLGYQGGEKSSLDSYLMVYQFDAHAWSEVWLQGKGWVRIDPTAAVSPSRITDGLGGALNGEEGFLTDRPLSLFRYQNLPGVKRLRHGVDYLRMLWIQNVVGYNTVAQISLLRNLFGSADTKIFVLALTSGLVGALLIILFAEYYGRKKTKPPLQERIYARFCRKLAVLGYRRNRCEGEISFAERISESDPLLGDRVLQFTKSYVELQYEDCSREEREQKLIILYKHARKFPPKSLFR